MAVGKTQETVWLFAFVTDIHGNFENLVQFIQTVRIEYPKVEYLLVGGDVSGRPSWNEDWSQAKTNEIIRGVKIFSSSGLRTFFIPGNDDIEEPFPPVCEYPNVIMMRREVVEIEPGTGLLGFSYVPPTPFGTRYERDEKTLEQMLQPLFKQLDRFEYSIVMCHAPPYGTNLDLSRDWYLKNGGIEREILRHVGCRSIRKLIKRYQPDVGLFGHVHESQGRCDIGRTICVNPGSSDREVNGCVFDRDWLSGLGGMNFTALPENRWTLLSV